MTGDTAARLHEVAARLRAVGERGLAREMIGELKAATVFLEADVRDAARRDLPRSGGLNEQQASQEISTHVYTGFGSAGVVMRTHTRGSMQTDKGFVRHPVFGEWLPGQASQQIPEAAGWWSDTLAERAPLAAPLLLAAMDRAAVFIGGV